MLAKIKATDDRIAAAALAILLIGRDRLRIGHPTGLVTESLADFRADYDGYKGAYPRRDLATARDLTPLTNRAARETYQQLLAAVDVVLARILRQKTQFSSLLELDNYLAASLRRFD